MWADAPLVSTSPTRLGSSWWLNKTSSARLIFDEGRGAAGEPASSCQETPRARRKKSNRPHALPRLPQQL